MGVTGLSCAVLCLRDEFQRSGWRTFRSCMFVGMGLSSIVAIIHGCYKYGVAEFNNRMRIDWMVYEGIQYGLGTILYAVRLRSYADFFHSHWIVDLYLTRFKSPSGTRRANSTLWVILIKSFIS